MKAMQAKKAMKADESSNEGHESDEGHENQFFSLNMAHVDGTIQPTEGWFGGPNGAIGQLEMWARRANPQSESMRRGELMFVHDGRVLDPLKRAKDYGLKDGDTVHLIVQIGTG